MKDTRTFLNDAMDRYADGDDAAFEDLYRGLAPLLLSFFLKRGSSEACAEEMVQQAFLQMHLARARYVTGFDVAPWAFAIARRLRIDAHRRSQREVPTEESTEEPAAGDALPDEELMAHETANALRRSFRSLTPAQREAFELVKGADLSLAQAATILGTTVTGVKLRMHRATQALREVANAAA
jgi:RNA polymerase sigma-70 factor (ECF subfamily)